MNKNTMTAQTPEPGWLNADAQIAARNPLMDDDDTIASLLLERAKLRDQNRKHLDVVNSARKLEPLIQKHRAAYLNGNAKSQYDVTVERVRLEREIAIKIATLDTSKPITT